LATPKNPNVRRWDVGFKIVAASLIVVACFTVKKTRRH
jgi:hypothetical protein